MAVRVTVYGTANMKQIERARLELQKLEAAAQSTTFTGRMRAWGDSMVTTGQKMTAAGRAMTTSLSLPLVGVGYAAYQATQAASDLAETQSKVGVVFGNSSKEIESWSATAATSMGQSKQQAMDAAASFAIFGQSAGLSGKDLVSFSTGLTSTAADMASFANTTPDEAIQAIGAALRGEAEPIRRYGVLLDDASLRQEALALGITNTTKQSLTPQQRVLAAQALIYKQLGKEGSNTIGDFARTSGGLANQQRIMQAELANTKAEIGTALIPVFKDLVGIIRTDVVPLIQRFADWFNTLSDGQKKAALAVGAFLAALGPATMVIGGVITGLGKLAGALTANPWLLLAAAVITAAVLIYQNWDKISAFLRRTWTAITGAATRAWNAVKDAVGNAVNAAREKVVAVGTWLVTHHPLYLLYQFAASWGPRVLSSFRSIGSNVVNAIRDSISNAWDNLVGRLRNLTGMLPTAVKKILGIASPSRVFANIGADVAGGLAVGIVKNAKVPQAAAAAMARDVSDMANRATAAWRSWRAGERASSVTSGSSNTSFSMPNLDKIATGIGKIGSSASKAKDKVNAAKQAVADLLSAVKQKTSDIMASFQIGEVFAPELMTAQQLLDAIKSQAEATKQFLVDIAKLKSAGLATGVVAALLAAGPAASAAQASAFASMTPDQIAQYNALYSQQASAAGSIAKLSETNAPNITIAKDAVSVKINIEGNANEKQIQTAVDNAFTELVKKLKAKK